MSPITNRAFTTCDNRVVWVGSSYRTVRAVTVSHHHRAVFKHSDWLRNYFARCDWLNTPYRRFPTHTKTTQSLLVLLLSWNFGQLLILISPRIIFELEKLHRNLFVQCEIQTPQSWLKKLNFALPFQQTWISDEIHFLTGFRSGKYNHLACIIWLIILSAN